jgi:hypothetical protein
MFDWIFKRNQRPDLTEYKKLVEQPVIPKKYVETEEAKHLINVIQIAVKNYIEARDSDMAQQITDVKKDIGKKLKDILQKEIDTAMKAHDQQNVLMVLGRMEEKLNEVVGNGRKD